jgi:hypothetical protein
MGFLRLVAFSADYISFVLRLSSCMGGTKASDFDPGLFFLGCVGSASHSNMA